MNDRYSDGIVTSSSHYGKILAPEVDSISIYYNGWSHFKELETKPGISFSTVWIDCQMKIYKNRR
jgi:hypothetical protein